MALINSERASTYNTASRIGLEDMFDALGGVFEQIASGQQTGPS